MKRTVIAVVGPTAVGKTKLSVEIAKRFNGEVISGDSMQIYRGMDIGTAKVTEEETQGIPHYMIDIKDPSEPFSAAEFQERVHMHIEEIHSRGKLPIIAGGTGLYIQSVIYNYNFSSEKGDEDFRQKLEMNIRKDGVEPYFEKLRKIDPEQAEKIHPNNIRRVIRALEVYETTGLTMTEYHKKQEKEQRYNDFLIGLEMDRQELYDRINARVDLMIEQGLLREVEDLYKKGLKDSQAMKAIGYKEFIPYFEGEMKLDSAIEVLKQNSRRYAKRQYTWFKNKMDVTWFPISAESANKKFEIILQQLAGKI